KGKDIINGLINGLKDMMGRVGDVVKSIADKITGGLSSALKIFSPSRVMMGLGGHVGEGLAIGIEQTGDRVKKTMAELVPVPDGPETRAAMANASKASLFQGRTDILRARAAAVQSTAHGYASNAGLAIQNYYESSTGGARQTAEELMFLVKARG
ncbi:phage tail protein, partial [Kitasatospora nipponensis]|uniref:phage tail protein n=1 Tax=Kitasatospora nipponensis TaxID=258049 RepID=UPI003CD05F53